MTITQVASELNRCEMTVRRWIQKGEIKAIKIGKHIDISPKELERVRKEKYGYSKRN